MAEDRDVLALMEALPAAQAAWMETNGLARQALLILMSACRNRCFFCASPAVTDPPPESITPWSRIVEFMGESAGLSRLCIGGTEPTTHPRFWQALELANASGFSELELMTSGVDLDLPRLVHHGLSTLAVPLYGPKHDRIVGLARLEETLRTLDRAHRLGVRVMVHTLALRTNLGDLTTLGRQVRERYGTTLTVAPVRAKSDRFDFASEAPTLSELGGVLEDVGLVGFPDCFRPDLTRASAPIISIYFQGQARTHPTACSSCDRRTGCPGMIQEYAELYGAAELSPFSGTP